MSLFRTRTGFPLRFYIGSLTQLSTPIKTNGGIVSPDMTSDCIHLIQYAPKEPCPDVYPHPVYSYEYIQDCLHSGKLFPISNYEVHAFLDRSQKSGFQRTKKSIPQMDLNALISFIQKHPVTDPQVPYWKWAAEKLNLGLSPEQLKNAYVKHENRLMQQGFGRSTSRPSPQLVDLEEGTPCKVRKTEILERESCPEAVSDTSITSRPFLSLSDRLSIKPTDLVVSITRGVAGRVIKNIGNLRVKSTEFQVLERFKEVVENCKKQGRAEVTEVEVLRVLLRNKGDVEKTVKDFVFQ